MPSNSAQFETRWMAISVFFQSWNRNGRIRGCHIGRGQEGWDMWFWGLRVAAVCVTGVVLVVRVLFLISSFSYFLLLWWWDAVLNLAFLRPPISSDFLDQCGLFQSLGPLTRMSPYFWFRRSRRHRPSACPRRPRRPSAERILQEKVN